MPTPTSKWLETPTFKEPPPRHAYVPRQNKVFPFEAILETVRKHPGIWAVIAEYKGGKEGGKRTTSNMIRKDHSSVWRWLLKHRPLEHWEVRDSLVEGTYADRELYVKFNGIMTPEEALKLEHSRLEAYSSKYPRDPDRRIAKQQRSRARADLIEREEAIAKVAMERLAQQVPSE
jgi:hypothetical protein